MDTLQASLAEGLARESARPVFWFNVPTKLRVKSGVAKLGFVALTANEEIQAAELSGKDATNIAKQMLLAHSLAKHSLRYLVSDKGEKTKLTLADNSADKFWGALDPGLRGLAMSAYNKIHSVEDDDSESFLSSMEVSVG